MRALAVAAVLMIAVPAKACDRWQGLCEPVAEKARQAPSRGRGKGVSLAGVVQPLAAKASSIARACGSRVVSARRNTRIAGTRIRSLHAYGKAVDLQGNPTCIYRMVRDWPGGVSTDYGAVRHVHLSYDPNGREWGRRFGHGRSDRRRFAAVSKRNIFRRYANMVDVAK